MGAIADAIVTYAQPLIDGTDGSLEQMNKALAISQACWNLAITPAEHRQSLLDGMRSAMNIEESEFADFERSVLTPMIRRHMEMFPRLHPRSPLQSPHWDTMPTPQPSKKQKEPAAPPGPYEPCPCNSGKKYRFCCGRRR
jgi:hypothetical protein